MPPSWSLLASPRGGDSLRAAKWSPPSSARLSAVLVFHHGYGEHVQRYDRGEKSRREKGWREIDRIGGRL
jgi:alpha-beta hydrolase superfamily lysophospholipase